MVLDSFKLEGQVAMVTGCSRGIGQALTVALAEAGADIAGVYNSSVPDETGTLVEQVGRRFLPLQFDFSKPTDFKQLIRRVVDEFGKIDILVNNAGTATRVPAIDYTEEDWDRVMQVNLKSVFFLSQAAARQYIVQGAGGKIINIASILSFQGGLLVPPYTASKSGIRGLTKSLSNEWAKENINVNAVAPGYIETDMTAALRADPERSRQIFERIPAGRWGKTDDLKGAVVFLASEASRYMHGFTIAVDGGWLGR